MTADDGFKEGFLAASRPSSDGPQDTSTSNQCDESRPPCQRYDLTIHFDPYAVGPYAEGMFHVAIDLKDRFRGASLAVGIQILI